MSDEQSLSNDNRDGSLSAASANLGSAFQAARLAKNLTQQDVSNSLRYSVKQIDALENNLFDILPDAMMTRGFIRSYAKYLQIDAEPLLLSYRSSLGAEDAHKVISVKSSMRPVALTKESPPWLKYILATIVVLLFLLAWMAYVEYMPKHEAVADANAQSNLAQTDAETRSEPLDAGSNAEALPEIALPAAERAAENDASPAMNEVSGAQINTVASAAAAPGADAGTVPQNAQAAAPAPAAVVPAPVAAQPIPSAARSLSLSFTGQSWVSIMDKSGKVIFEKLYHSGESDTVQASPPLNVVVGNAGVTKLIFSGQEVDLATKSKNNVARITLE